MRLAWAFLVLTLVFVSEVLALVAFGVWGWDALAAVAAGVAAAAARGGGLGDVRLAQGVPRRARAHVRS